MKLIFIVGPTACGKSEFAVQAAEALSSSLGFMPEIINGDSVQFFAELDIGAAKPEPELLARVRHHLVGTVPVSQDFTAGDFRRHALHVLEEARLRGLSTLFCVGGSGFYLQALEKGMYPVPEIPLEVRMGVENDLRDKGAEALYQELARRDPETAARIQVNDLYRIGRSLEILRASVSGETLSQMKARFDSEKEEQPFVAYKYGLMRSRESLRVRIIARTRKMLQAGLIEEVKQLRVNGFGDRPPLHSVGYREVQEFLDGSLSADALESQIVTSTMQLAKRQMTWFKRDPSICWFDADAGLQAACEVLKRDF